MLDTFFVCGVSDSECFLCVARTAAEVERYSPGCSQAIFHDGRVASIEGREYLRNLSADDVRTFLNHETRIVDGRFIRFVKAETLLYIVTREEADRLIALDREAAADLRQKQIFDNIRIWENFLDKLEDQKRTRGFYKSRAEAQEALWQHSKSSVLPEDDPPAFGTEDDYNFAKATLAEWRAKLK